MEGSDPSKEGEKEKKDNGSQQEKDTDTGQVTEREKKPEEDIPKPDPTDICPKRIQQVGLGYPTTSEREMKEIS